MTQLDQRDLRPLGIGELLDRAVTLLVRRFAVLALILALVAIPLAIIQYASSPATAGLAAQIQALLTLPPGHPEEQRAILRQLSAGNRLGPLGFGLVVLSAVLSTLSTTACMIGVAQAYAGRLPSVRAAYRAALGRWLPQLVAVVAFVAFGFILAVVLTLAAVFVAVAVVALSKVSHPAALLLGIPSAALFAVVFLGVTVLLYFAAQMSLVAIALEDPNPIRGIAQGLRRTLSPPIFWRSALVAGAVFAVSLIGSLILLAVAGGMSALTRIDALYPVIAVIGGVALNALLTTFMVVYTFDVRVRREGYDLAVAAQGPPP